MLPVVILAGGLGTRLYPLTKQKPKSLIDINGEPFIAHQLRLLKKNKIQHVVICTGHLSHHIEAFVGDGSSFGLTIRTIQDGDSLLGTAGAVRQALPLLDNSFFILYGDAYLPCCYSAIQKSFFKSQRPALMTVFKNNNLWDKSNVQFQNGRIIAYNKLMPSPNMQHIDYGLSIMTKTAIDQFIHSDLSDLFVCLLAQQQLAAFEVKERFYEVGSHSGIRAFRRYLKEHIWNSSSNFYRKHKQF